MTAFEGPYSCPVCDEMFETTLDLATHNESTGHLNQVPVLKRMQKHRPLEHPVKIKVRRIVQVDLGGGFIIEKEVYT